MSDINTLVERLKLERDHSARNALAIQLAETRNPIVLDVILSLIERPELVDNRATLVHCMGYFDCSPYFTILAVLVAKGNWEVAHEAYAILNDIEKLSGEQAAAGFDVLSSARDSKPVDDWRAALIEDLLSMFD